MFFNLFKTSKFLDRERLRELISKTLDELNQTYTEDNLYSLLYFFMENYIDVVHEKYPDANFEIIKSGLLEEIKKL